MAFNTQQAHRTRAAVLVIALLIVAIIAVVVVVGMGSSRLGASSADDTATAGNATATTGTTDDADDAEAMDTVDAQYGTATRQLLAQYDADPSNSSTLINVANSYFDWGVAALNHATTTDDHTHATDLLGHAIEYYDTYLESNPLAKSAIVDRAICRFYTGDTDTAIAELEDLVTNVDAAFAPAWANLGMFYESAGRVDDARTAYQTAIDAAGDDDAYNVTAYAQERLSALDDAS